MQHLLLEGHQQRHQLVGAGLALLPSAAQLFPNGPGHFKARYVAYTDDTFTKKAPVVVEAGILGPTLRAQVGDTISVTFINRTPQSFSVHPHGVLYTKFAEGAGYQDGASAATKFDDSILPGSTYTYKWFVPNSAGPASGDTSSVGLRLPLA